MIYLQGRSNLACTVFTPTDCTNNCEFCTTKELYNRIPYKDENLVKICRSITSIINKCNSIREYVITGGEPTRDLAGLRMMLGCMDKPVFINTCFKEDENREEFIDLVNSEPKIAGINISRHMKSVISMTQDWLDDDREVMDRIEKPVRVNCIISKEEEPCEALSNRQENIFRFVNTYASVKPYRMVNFRADYRGITVDNLKNYDNMAKLLLNNYIYTGSNSCLVCNSMFFKNLDGRQICWHRGLPSSAAVYGEFCYVNDVIISPDGNLYKDWDMTADEEFVKSLVDEANPGSVLL